MYSQVYVSPQNLDKSGGVASPAFEMLKILFWFSEGLGSIIELTYARLEHELEENFRTKWRRNDTFP